MVSGANSHFSLCTTTQTNYNKWKYLHIWSKSWCEWLCSFSWQEPSSPDILYPSCCVHLAIGILATQLWKISVYRNKPSATFMEMRVLPINNYNYVYKIALGWKRAIILSVSSWPGNKTRHRDTQSALYRSHIMPEKEESKSYTTNDLHCNSPALCVRVHWKLHAQSMDTEYQLGWVYAEDELGSATFYMCLICAGCMLELQCPLG